MSKINVFPNTVIQTNGDTPYILRTIERTGSLNHVEIESKTNDVINIDMQDIEFSSVSIKGGSEIGETTLLWVRNSMNVQPWSLVENRILTCTDELKEQYADELQFLVSRGYNIDVPVSSFITVDLNYEWTPDVFPGPTGYGKEDGWLSFGSTSNYHDYTQASTAYLRFKGNGRKLHVYAGGSGRYTSGYVYNMDSETEVLMSLPNMSLPNRTSINYWANIEIDIPNDNQDHFIKFTYPARSSTYQYLDRAGFLVNVNDVDMVIKDYKDKPEPGSYLRFTAKDYSVNINFSLPGVFEYKKNAEDDWFVWDRELTLQPDEYIDVKGYGFDNPIVLGLDSGFSMSGTGKVEASGDITSLLNGEGGNVAITKEYQFSALFKSCSNLITPPNLPSTTLAKSCYSRMFYKCSRLKTPPALPATTLANSCYYSMFENSALNSAPELPATILTDNCYTTMFASCNVLREAPVLPATTLAKECYSNMFAKSGITSAPELPATTLTDSCYSGMFYHCYSLTVASELPATELADSCYSGMFWDCKSLTNAPELPVTELVEKCYNAMFEGCIALTTPPELPATTLANSCYYSMFEGCENLESAPELPATILADYCYTAMFKKCNKLATAPELPATTLTDYCYTSMFSSCKALTTAPELPATTLAKSSYDAMFQACSELNYVKIGAETPSPLNMDSWLDMVASTGTLEITNNILEVTRNNVNSCPPGWNIVRPTEPQPGVNLTLDLNNEWSRSNITNPDPTNYDMYMSASNWHVDSATSSMYLVVQSNQDEYEFKFLVCADCEQYYDQVKAYEPGSETGVHANISTWGDGAYLSNYTEVVYNPLQGSDTKRLKLSYVKDMSSYSGNDRGFLLVPKGTPFNNEYVG